MRDIKLPSDFTITRYDTYLRLAREDDAEFILSLRLNPNRNEFLSSVSQDVNDQINWLKEYKEREKKGEEYYFLVGDISGKLYGTIRLYHFQENKFVAGSWIFREDTPEGLSIKGDIVGRDIAFEELKFNTCLFDVRKNNSRVLKYQKSWNPELIGEDEQNFFFKLTHEKFNQHKLKLLKLLGYGY
jgi:hypothetical protein